MRSWAPRRAGGAPCPLLAAAVLAAWALAGAGGGPQAVPEARAAAVSKDVYQGWKWFHVYCYRCHGTDAVSNPGLPGPDLRQSVKNLSKDDFLETVHEGRLPKGMPAWGQLLTDVQIRELYAYVTARSQGSLRPGRPDEQ